MDARIDVHRMLDLDEGDAHVIRNAGGVVTDDVIRSVTLSQKLLETNEILVVMHNDCGLHGLSDAEFRDRVQADSGLRPQWVTEGFPDLDQAVREGVAKLRASPFIPNDTRISGLVYDPENRSLRPVV
jgi:carbonic anhydrase